MLSSNIIHNLKKRMWFYLLVSSYLLFSYNTFGGWWNSSAGSLLIVFFSYMLWGRDFLTNTGLRINWKTAVKSIILAAVVTLCSFIIMRHIADSNNVLIRPGNWRDYYHDIFYILNEEIVLGAVILFALVNRKKLRPVVACALLAVAFSLIHFVFYKWIFDDRGILGICTLATLFLIGFVRNYLIIQTGHIGYSWALHFGWIAVMFGSMHVYRETNLAVSESGRFNMYLGSVGMLIISVIIATICLAHWYKKHSAPMPEI